MNHTMSNAGSATNQCARFIAALVFNLRALASTVRINKFGGGVLSRGLFGIYSSSLSSLNKADFLGWRNCTPLPFRHAALSRTYANELD